MNSWIKKIEVMYFSPLEVIILFIVTVMFRLCCHLISSAPVLLI